jgi:antitoxin Phd
MAWQVQEARAKFSEFLEASLTEGPQIVTRRGVETAVLVPIEEWRKAKGKELAQQSLKDFLLAPEPRIEDMNIPPRGRYRRRRPPKFD